MAKFKEFEFFEVDRKFEIRIGWNRDRVFRGDPEKDWKAVVRLKAQLRRLGLVDRDL